MGDISLLCSENFDFLDDGSEWDVDVNPNEVEVDDGYVDKLVEREIEEFGFSRVVVGGGGDWLVGARLEAVRWILDARVCFGFGIRTAYLAVSYFDRFFLVRTIERRQSWAVKLLSIACLSIASKMEECRVPLLSEFQVDGYCFDCNDIRRMELLVLSTLGWQARSVTPFSYLSYLTAKLDCKHRARELMLRAIEVILSAIEKMNLVDYRPLTIAMAAYLVVSGQGQTKKSLESELAIIPICGSLDVDDVLSCCNLLQEIERKKPKGANTLTSKNIALPNYPYIRSSIDDPNETIPCTRISMKRRKLNLNV